jgi:two-component sensor histidine kinase
VHAVQPMSRFRVTCISAKPALDVWPPQIKCAVTAFAVAIATLIELPGSFDAPGKPFLLYFIVSSLCTLAFGRVFGLLAIGASSVLSILFFDPVYEFWLSHQKDLIEIIAFVLVGGAGVLALARVKSSITAGVRVREQQRSHLMLSEMAHRVANNFAAVGAILGRASTSVHDAGAKRALDDALNRLHIFACVHNQLQPDRDGNLYVDGEEFAGGLCAALEKTIAHTAKLKFEPPSITIALPLPKAVALGLIINELVTNAAKYAFPDGRCGTIVAAFTIHGKECHVCVADNGSGKAAKAKGSGRGLGLVEGLTEQLSGRFSMETSPEGTRAIIRFPLRAPPD